MISSFIYDSTCTDAFLAIIVAYLSIDFIFIITTIIAFQSFIQNQINNSQSQNNDEPLPKSLYYSGLIFIIITCLSLLFQVSILRECYPELEENYMFQTIWLCGFIAYWIQYYLLIIHLFIRIEIIFKDTIFSISPCTRRIFIIIFILSLITCPISPLPWFIHEAIFYGSGMCLFGALSLLLMIICVRKLTQIYKSAEQDIVTSELQLESQPDNPEVIGNVIARVSTIKHSIESSDLYKDNRLDERNDKILLGITKMFILGLISVCISIIGAAYVVIYSWNQLQMGFLKDCIIFNEKVLSVIFYGVYLCDIYANFICVMLSFKVNERWYKRMCGCCDKCCQCCCKYFILQSVKRKTLRTAYSNSKQNYKINVNHKSDTSDACYDDDNDEIDDDRIGIQDDEHQDEQVDEEQEQEEEELLVVL